MASNRLITFSVTVQHAVTIYGDWMFFFFSSNKMPYVLDYNK